jgi:signal transduction histidine kinase
MSDEFDDDHDERARAAERQRARDEKAREREAKAADRQREREVKQLEREAKALERAEDREAKALERAREDEAREREREALQLEREARQLEREREQRERERVAKDRARAGGEPAGDRGAGGDPEDPADADSADDSPSARWRRQERKWAHFAHAWQHQAEHRRQWEARRREHHARWHKRRRRWKDLEAERAMWMRMRDSKTWGPWWLQARMRRKIFTWLAFAFASGAIGMYMTPSLHWWHAVVAAVVLSAMSGMIAFRLTRPLLMVVQVAQDIGDGKLDTRLDVDGHRGETRLLAMAINDMAARIQQQVVDQRQLLAAVSHELRTPLGHMRVLIDTARAAADCKALAELEGEVLVLDDLVGKLLASSRLEFGNLDCRPLDLGALVTDIATAAGVAPESIEASGDVRAAVDPTLVRRAVANLLDNARVHGGGPIAVRIERRAAQVAIEVDDAGPGVAADRRADAFRAFVPSRAGGLGLGLALVSRIAVAHGGGAWITDRPGGGARVGFTVEVSRSPGAATA